MSLQPQLNAILEGFQQHAPQAVVQTITKANVDFASTFDYSSAIKVGSTLPAFSLPSATGKQITSTSLLAHGPILITFYRGSWCPFCNLFLHSLERVLPTITAKGVTLVAISPELPDQSLTFAEKAELRFPVLSDVGNKFARELGIVFKQPDSMRPIFEQFKHDLKTWNGDDSFEVPVPATFLVDKEGVVRNLFLDTDYTKRVEPDEMVRWIDAL